MKKDTIRWIIIIGGILLSFISLYIINDKIDPSLTEDERFDLGFALFALGINPLVLAYLQWKDKEIIF
jgi:uncharacterized membrane protein YidH (DUF202 family)